MAHQAPEPRPAGVGDPRDGGSAGARRVVWFGAPACAHCATTRPRLDAVARRFPEVDLDIVDATQDPDRARVLGVLGTPTIVALDGEEEVGRLVGSHGEAAIERLFTAPATEQRTTDGPLWLVTGAVLGLVGALTGPAWVLVGIGAALAGYGVVRVLR